MGIPPRLLSLIRRILPLPNRKEGAELHFQTTWAREFVNARDRVEEYWNTYRHLGRVIRETGIDDDSRILDVGCGISTVLHFLPGKRVGIDPLADHYRKLYQYPPGIEIHAASGEAIPFPDGSFDVAFCSNVLDHCDAPTRVIAEIHRVLGEDGFLFLSVETHLQRVQRDPAHPHSLTRGDVAELIEVGFQVVFEECSPWIGLRRFVRGLRSFRNRELVILLRKTNQQLAASTPSAGSSPNCRARQRSG